jgi:hypothetical protein
MTFAKHVFRWAGIYGLLAVTPQFFLESETSRQYPPAITHPEFYYGFVGTVVAFQCVFLVIATDPVRYRPLMLPSVLEKVFFAAGMPILYLQHRISVVPLVFSQLDLMLGFLFTVSYIRTAGPDRSITSPGAAAPLR